MSERGCDPDVVIARLHCAARYIVCPEVEGAAAFQIEARVVPMARQDTVLDGPSLEREAHVWTSIIEGKDSPAVVDDKDGAIATLHDKPPLRFQRFKASHEHKFAIRCIHAQLRHASVSGRRSDIQLPPSMSILPCPKG